MRGHMLQVNDQQPDPEDFPQELSCSRRCGLALCIAADIAIFVPLYLHRYHFDVHQLIDDDVKPFTPEAVGKSLIDLGVLLLLRVVSAIGCIVHKEGWAYHTLLFFCAWLAFAKLIVVSYWTNVDTVVAVISSLIFSFLYWFLSFRPSTPKTLEQIQKQRATLRSVLKILRPYFWPDGFANRLRVMSTWVFLGISKATNIAAPLYFSMAVQQLTNDKTLPYGWITAFAGLSLLSKTSKELQTLVYLKVKQTAFAQVSVLTFAHIHSLSLEWHLKKKMGQVLRAMDRGIAAADNVVQYVFLMLLPTFAECGITMAIFWFHFKLPILAAVALLSLVVYCWCTVVLTLWRKKFREETNRHDNDYHDKATDSLLNYETVKYFANEEFEKQRYAESIEKYQKFSVAMLASLSILNTSQQLVVNLCLCLGLMEAGYAVLHGELQIGDFVAVQIYMTNLFTPLNFLGTIYGMMVQAGIDMQNLSDLLSQDPDIKDAPRAPAIKTRYDSRGVELEFKKVAFHYLEQPADNGLKDISFTVPPGTTTAIVGHTGAGKSTISRLIFRFYDVLDGEILVDGQNVASVTQSSLRKLIGMVPQDTVLFNDTIQYNIQYGNLSASFEEVERAAADAQILEFIRTLPEGWKTIVGERGLKLSGGEKQRVAIARCLLKDPAMVVLDEATSALDTRTEKDVQGALQCLKGRTTLVIAHRLSTIHHANQILVLGHGVVLEKGTHDELMEKGGEYFQMCKAQVDTAPPSSPVDKSSSSAPTPPPGDS